MYQVDDICVIYSPSGTGTFISEGHLTRHWVTTADQDELYFCYEECGDDFFDIYARNHSRPPMCGLLFRSQRSAPRSLWEYQSKYEVTLELDEQYHFKPVRVGDGSLMALFFQFPFDHRQAERFNRVRHFKGVVRVSDIISCDGRTVEPSMLDNTSGIRLIRFHTRSLTEVTSHSGKTASGR